MKNICEYWCNMKLWCAGYFLWIYGPDVLLPCPSINLRILGNIIHVLLHLSRLISLFLFSHYLHFCGIFWQGWHLVITRINSRFR